MFTTARIKKELLKFGQLVRVKGGRGVACFGSRKIVEDDVRVDDPAIVPKAQDSLTRSYVCVLLHITTFS